MKDLSFNTISACNIELDATVFAAEQNKANIPGVLPVSGGRIPSSLFLPSQQSANAHNDDITSFAATLRV
ncbi:MAG TPA: hypothetical protein VII40_16435 [Xanthobacteraceae bacterium]